MAQATGAIQPTAAAIRRTMLQQTQVGLMLACGLSGPLVHTLWWQTSDSYESVHLRTLVCICGTLPALTSAWPCGA